MAGGKPYQSKLIPYENEILAMRRKRPPVPYSQIAAKLNENYQLNISVFGVFDFFKRRATQKQKTYKYEPWDTPDAQPDTETAVLRKKPTVSKPPVSDKPKQAEKFNAEKFNIDTHVLEYHDLRTYQPEYLDKEEAARLLQEIKNERKRK